MKKILIVEDDEAIRTELITLLWANGYLPVDAHPLMRSRHPKLAKERIARTRIL